MGWEGRRGGVGQGWWLGLRKYCESCVWRSAGGGRGVWIGG